MKKWIALVVVLGAGIGGFSAWNKWQKNKPASAAENRPTTAVVELRDISFAVNAAGEIGPAEQVSVRPEINGLIEQLPVDVGDHVKKDSLLFKLNDKELQQTRSSNLTDIQRAKHEIEKADLDYE